MCALTVLAIPVQAQAQEGTYVRAFFGATFGNQGGGAVGGGVGIKATKKLQITGEFGFLSNVIPKSVADAIDQQAAIQANIVALGGKASSDSSAKAQYGLVGFRATVRNISNGSFFIEVGGGVAHVTSKISAEWRSLTGQGTLAGLVTTSFTNSTPETKPMAAIGGGLALPLGKSSAIEMAYRYATIMTTGTKINTSKVYGAVRVGF
jgi:hypothetical protein